MNSKKRKDSSKNISQDIIWDTITNSAKLRFDYEDFASEFEINGIGQAAENILFKIIVDLAVEIEVEQIAFEINEQLLLLGIQLEEKELIDLIVGKQDLFSKEINAYIVAKTMIDQDCSLDEVLASVVITLS